MAEFNNIPTPTPLKIPGTVTFTTIGAGEAVPNSYDTVTKPLLDQMRAGTYHPIVQAAQRAFKDIKDTLPPEAQGPATDTLTYHLGPLSTLNQANNLANQVEDHLDNISSRYRRTMDAIYRENPTLENDPNASSKISKYIGTAQGLHTSSLSSIADGIGSIMTTLGNISKSIINGVLDMINGFAGAITSAIASVVSGVASVIGAVLSPIFGALGGAFTGLFSGVGSTLSGIANSISGKMSSVSSAVAGESAAITGALVKASTQPFKAQPSNVDPNITLIQASDIAANPPVLAISVTPVGSPGMLALS